MWVCALDRVDVAALLASTRFEIYEVERDDDQIREVGEYARYWWQEYIVGDREPPADSPAEALRIAKKRYPADDGETANATVGECALVTRYVEAKAQADESKAAVDEAQAELCAAIGARKSLVSPAGKASWSNAAGGIKWRAVAEELSGGKVDPAIANKHRGDPSRRFRFTKSKNGS